MILEKELTYQIIGVAIGIHQNLLKIQWNFKQSLKNANLLIFVLCIEDILTRIARITRIYTDRIYNKKHS